MRRTLLALTVALSLAACASDATLEPEIEEAEPAAPVHVDVEPAATGLTFTAQPGWVAEKPTNRMRKAQFMLPRIIDDPADASLVVFHFGGGGGGVEGNIARWATQFEQDDGSPTRDTAKVTERTVNGMAVTLVDMAGRYVAETTPGSGERVDRPRYRMRAAIIEAPDGNYFVKLVGPERTVGAWTTTFDKYVDSAR